MILILLLGLFGLVLLLRCFCYCSVRAVCAGLARCDPSMHAFNGTSSEPVLAHGRRKHKPRRPFQFYYWSQTQKLCRDVGQACRTVCSPPERVLLNREFSVARNTGKHSPRSVGRMTKRACV